MSWFTDLAGKAEDFLNKIDENAAMAITQATEKIEKKSKKASPRRKDENEKASLVFEDTSSSSYNDIQGQDDYNVNGNQQSVDTTDAYKLSNIGTSNGAKDSSPEDCPEAKSTSNPNPPKNSPKSKSKGKPGNNTKIKEKKTEKVSNSIVIPNAGRSKAEESELIDFLNDPNRKELDEKLVLQTELANQAREMELLYKANKQLQSDNESLKIQIIRQEQEKMKAKENLVHEMEGELKQADATQKNLKRLLTDKDAEIIKLKKSLDQSLEKLQQLEVLQATQFRLETVEMEKDKLMQSNQELNESLTSLNEKIQNSEYQISQMRSSFTSLENEFTGYKEKAKSILKQKDDLITSLKSDPNSKHGFHGQDFDDGESPFQSEINALKSERELLHAEVSQCRSTTDSLREETQRLELELSSMRGLISQTQKQLVDEKTLTGSLQDENLQLRQQFSALQFELDLEKSERRKLEEWKSQKELSEENNIVIQPSHNSQGRFSPNNSSFNGDSEETLRMRITALSQSLLEKQSLINNLSSDKQLLQINVERLQEQIRHTGLDQQASSSSADFSHTVISSKPLYLSESPWDSSGVSGMKRAFSTVDSLCCQAGLALRRRPNLRLGFCIYIIVLHFWVLFILFNSFNHVPELHNGNSRAPM